MTLYLLFFDDVGVDASATLAVHSNLKGKIDITSTWSDDRKKWIDAVWGLFHT